MVLVRSRVTVSATALALAFAATAATVLGAQAQLELLSRAVEQPTTAGGDSSLGPGSALSRDGRYVVFVSDAANLVPGQVDANPGLDVFLKDLSTGETVLVSHSVSSPLQAGNAISSNPSVSADGRYVAFESKASDLAAGVFDAGPGNDVFLFDRTTGAVSLVSHLAWNSALVATGESVASAISADGRFVAYVSTATDLCLGQIDVASGPDVFLFDRFSDTNVLVSHAAGSAFQATNGMPAPWPAPAISNDGSLVAFESTAMNIVAGQTGTTYGKAFLYTRSSGGNTLVSHTLGNSVDGAYARVVALSGNGRYVYFSTTARLSGSDVDTDLDHYRFDRTTGTIALVSNVYGGGPVATSFDGEWAAYGDGTVYLFDGRTGSSRVVSHPPGAWSPADLSGVSWSRAISDDGRYVAYSSTAADLVAGQIDVAGDYGPFADAFLYDRDSDRNSLLSRQMGGALLAAGSLGDALPVISGNGNTVVFATTAPTLVQGDTNHHTDLFAYARSTQTVGLISRRAPTLSSASANRESWLGSWGDLGSATRSRFSADGRWVLFQSTATNLLPGQPDDGLGILPSASQPGHTYMRDRVAGTTTLVSHALGSLLRPANRPATEAAISADGRFVVFSSEATDLVSAPITDGRRNLYLFDRGTGANTLVSRSAADASRSAAGESSAPAISEDGRFVAFQSSAGDLVPGQIDVNASEPYGNDVFLRDRLAGTTSLVSRRWDNALATGNKESRGFSLSSDGRFTAFESGATDLVPSQTGPSTDNVFLFDRAIGTNRLASHADGAPAQGGARGSNLPQLSADGRYLAYRSWATDIVAGISSSSSVFLFEVGSGLNSLVTDEAALGPSLPRRLTINSDGRFVAYESRGWELPGQTDYYQSTDVYLYDRLTGQRSLVSHVPGAPLAAGSGDSQVQGISADGRTVLFASFAQNLNPNSGTATTGYLFDRITGANHVVSTTPGPSNALWGQPPSLSPDGTLVGFWNASPLLVSNDFNSFGDAFVYSVAIGADLVVTKTGPASAQPGEMVSFSIGLTNVGRLPAEGVVLDDSEPVGLVPGLATGACASFPCSLGTLEVGDARQVDVAYTIPVGYSSPAPIVNVATASTLTPDIDPSNNTAFAQVTLPSAFYTVPPCRLADTRDPNGPFGGPALVAGGARIFTVPGSCGVPDGVKSLAVNVTVVAPTQMGFVRLAPVAAVTPETSTINFRAGQTRANNAVVPVGVGGKVSAALGTSAGQAHLILDVVGYFK